MKSAIVTGATGFIGVHLVEELVSRGVNVTALIRTGSANTGRLPADVTVINCDMDDYDKLAERISGKRPDVFYHLAWDGATGSGRADASLQLKNVRCTIEALKAAKKSGCAKFVAAGTIYENFSEQMASALQYRSAAPYILSKKYARDMSRQLAFQLEIDFTWCTFCHPIGRYIKQDQLFAYAVRNLLNSVSPAFGPARDWFDVIDVEDLAAGLYIAGEGKLSKTDYYIGSGDARVLRDYLTELPKILCVETNVMIDKKSDDGMRFNPEWFNSTPFFSETGFAPRFCFQQAVMHLKDYILELMKCEK